MRESLNTYVTFLWAILASIYLFLSFISFFRIISVKNNLSRSDLIIPSNQLLSFFFFLFIFFVTNTILIRAVPEFFAIKEYMDMIAVQFYLISSMLFLILMKEIGLLRGISYCFAVYFTVSVVTILIADICFLRYSKTFATVLMRTASLAINILIYLTFAMKIRKEHVRSHFFTSKARVIEMALLTSYNLLLNYVALYYLISSWRYSTFTVLFVVGLASQLFAAFRILWKKSAYINNLENQCEMNNLPSLNSIGTLTEGEADIQKRLLEYFENEKPYLSPDVSLGEVALRMFTNKTYLSKIINVNMDKNFRELVNYYRIRDAMKYYSGNRKLTIVDLCKMSGFRNNASFTNAFKVNTGFTPGEWCRQMKNKVKDSDETI